MAESTLEAALREKAIRELVVSKTTEVQPQILDTILHPESPQAGLDAVVGATSLACGLIAAQIYVERSGETLSRYRFKRARDGIREWTAERIRASGVDSWKLLTDAVSLPVTRLLVDQAVRQEGLEKARSLSEVQLVEEVSRQHRSLSDSGRVDSVIRDATREFIAQAATDALDELDCWAARVDELRRILGFKRVPTKPAQPYIQPHGELRQTMSNFIYQAAQKAIEDAGLFTQGTATIAQRGKEVRLELKPTEAAQGFLTPEQRVQLAEEVERLCSGLGDLHVDVLDVLVQMHLKQALDPAEFALARVDDILQQRALKAKPSGQGRRGGFSTQQRDEVIKALRAIASLHATVTAEPGSRVPREAAGSGRLFVVKTSDGEPLDSLERIEAIQFRPGRLLAPFLSGKWRQTAWVSVRAQTYNPKTHAVEKRLLRYFAYQWRVRASSGTFLQPYRIQTLLSAVGLDLDSGNPQRTMSRLEKALTRLEDDGVIAAWQYEDWDRNIYETLRKGWAQHWLGWSIVVEPPDEVRSLYTPLLTGSPRPAPLRDSIARRVGARRRELGITVLMAAEQLDLDKDEMLAIEHGKRKFSNGLPKWIERWLQRD